MIKNIQKAIQEILDEDFISLEEMAIKCGLSFQGLKKIIDGKTKRVQRATIRKIAEGTGRNFEIRDGEIYFYKKIDDNKKELELSEEEKEILMQYRSLPEPARKNIKNLLEMLVKKGE